MDKKKKRLKIKYRVRKSIKGTAERPRLSVFKSNTHIYCQIIDDVNGITLANASSSKAGSGTKVDQAKEVGKQIAEKAKSQDISTVVFDRGGFLYHGRIKALADAARESGLQF